MNKENLNDPLYLGLRQNRVSRTEMEEFMTEFMEAMTAVFPGVVVQFEDFSTENALYYLDLFKNRYPCFNDDIQGTGSVIYGGFLNAAKLASEAPGGPALADHRILFYGSGSAAIGVGQQLMSFFTNLGLSVEEAKKRFYYMDSKGLIYQGRPSGAFKHKAYFARTDYAGPPVENLRDVIDLVKPTALFGLSKQKDAFTEAIVSKMSVLNPRPIIFPLTNPTSFCELDHASAVKWSRGKVLYASGSPYPLTEYEGKLYEPGQGNNMYVFPGIGLGAILCGARRITDRMIERAGTALAHSLTAPEQSAGLIYPRLPRIREVSVDIAGSVIRQAQQEDVDSDHSLRHINDNALRAHIRSRMYNPAGDTLAISSKL